MIVSSRKEDHIRLAAEQQDQPASYRGFDDIEILHHALAGIDRAQVDTSVTVGPWTWRAPFYVTGMTGGTETAMTINRALARATAATGIPMASGSIGIALDYPETSPSFTVIREENPDGIVLANIGAGRSLDDAKRAVDLLSADGLQLHLNSVQETVMPEGSRDFSAWLGLVEQIASGLDVPIIVKEVGFGLSAKTLTELKNAGVTIADVAGSGGTDFAKIENDRRSGGHDDYSYLNGFGSSAVQCLLDARLGHHVGPNADPNFTVLASGGVRHPLDVVKSVAMGARAVGVAGTFLKVALSEGADAMTEVLEIWMERVGQLQAMMGAATPGALEYTDILVRGRSREFADLRGLDVRALARRSQEAS
ncbi:type 2 isopentenyl-diphosphate Delta-isomerase [Flaviflexus equikiangi]|uniref:type 2 isopentenyl-diphosphate Delta-isomerase n=1 Tax=Flaviflexus equikiangi TaxID=2758573 RepID=UPI0015F4E49C|nr:type 2 isopentenyl-diphosphate Delta-isomerase [Flaviflexus equikiangi]